MLSHPKEPETRDISGMNRDELISALLEFNNHSVFQFTPSWLRRQWTSRLRTLLHSAYQQYEARST